MRGVKCQAGHWCAQRTQRLAQRFAKVRQPVYRAKVPLSVAGEGGKANISQSVVRNLEQLQSRWLLVSSIGDPFGVALGDWERLLPIGDPFGVHDHGKPTQKSL